MRLLIKLQCMERCTYEMQYHYHLQGFIYNLIRGRKYHYIHNKEGYKFFCFSNIFPAKDLEKNDSCTLIVSSPDCEFIECLYDEIQHPCNKAEIKVGHMKFGIDFVDKLVVKLPDNLPITLITGTPIIVRVPNDKYKTYYYLNHNIPSTILFMIMLIIRT